LSGLVPSSRCGRSSRHIHLFHQLEGTLASDSLKVNAARGDVSPLRDEISVRAGFEVEDAAGINWLPFSRTSDSPLVPALAKLEKALRLDRLAGISLWVIVRFRAADAPAGPDGHPH